MLTIIEALAFFSPVLVIIAGSAIHHFSATRQAAFNGTAAMVAATLGTFALLTAYGNLGSGYLLFGISQSADIALLLFYWYWNVSSFDVSKKR